MKKFKNAGKRLNIWTVNNLNTARKYCEMGVDGITSNHASFLKDAIVHA